MKALSLAFAGCLAVALASAGAATAQAATVWDETVNGDFSNNGLAPTPVGLGIGSNRVVGATGDSGQGIDRDYFSFTVPVGSALTSIVLLDNTTFSGDVSFIAMQAGPLFTVTPSGGGIENLLAVGHYGSGQINTNILPDIAIGFSGALPSGSYSVWVQEIGGPVTYGFDFAVTAVPEPETWALLVAGLGLLGVCARRRRNAMPALPSPLRASR